MDLTRLYNFTTSELRDEAQRLGIGDTYAMSRGQLIQAIREHLEPPTARKKGLFGRVVGFAKWAVQAAVETGDANEEEADDENEPSPEPAREADPPPLAEGEASEVEAPPTPALELGTVSDPLPSPDSEPASSPEPETGTRAEAPPQPEPITSPEPDPAPGAASSRPPAGVFANNGGLFEEPIPTRTMARILAEQGHFKRSLAIYARLLDEEPDDGDLVAEVNAVREDAKTRRSYAPQ